MGLAAAAIIALLLGYVVVVGVLRSRPLTLPAPSGPFPVGRSIVTVPAGSTTPDEPRRAAWVWYPAQPGSADDAPRVDYVPDGWSGPGTLPPTVGVGWLLQDVGAVTAWARRDATPAPGPAPVVVLAPGFETAPWMYTTLGEELASRGRVVALLVPPTTPARVVDGMPRTSPTAPAPPTGAEVDSLIHRQSVDMTALLNAFTSADPPVPVTVDARRTVFAGHSLGGGAAVRACELEPRCVGSINMDGPQPDRAPAKPELLLGSDRSCAAVTPCAEDGAPRAYTDWLVQRRAGSPPTSTATITGAGHNSFGDPVHYFVAPPVGAAAGVGDIPAHRMHAVLTRTLDTTIDELLHHGHIGHVEPGVAAGLPELVRLPD
ncbi:hypothetical protein [Pseudonocardia alaniniphila]|uniref:Alpha/beta hydrolase family protein n=1 Tax=Pseudonocardia alaniniphila TaxID=75291 RepID=A0ABS9TL99_9PSEU|nr:hypothetical protein [Pseudonocardia alaniniphila]MCH6169325.1 hypothetical protein [Pseudonocardia alaniniphila]